MNEPHERNKETQVSTGWAENYPRKAHRVNLPLIISVAENHYQAFDWSVSGVGIKNMLPRPALGAQLDVQLTLPLPGAHVSVPARIICRRHSGELNGFEFVELSESTRRILRHYIEHAIEGKLANVDNLVAVAAVPALTAQFPTALQLTDLQRSDLALQLRRRSVLAKWMVVLVAAALAALIFYNTTYRLATTGWVGGTLEPVSANNEGVVSQLFVQPGERVEKNSALFTISNRDDLLRLEVINKSLANLAIGLVEARSEEERFLSDLVEPGEAMLAERSAEYERAKKLYQQGVMALTDYTEIAHQLQSAQLEFLTEQGRLRTSQASRLAQIEQRRDELLNERNALNQRINSSTVLAQANGTLLRIEAAEGQFVTRTDTVVVIERDVAPQILVILTPRQALMVNTGMPAEIYLPQSKDTYQAVVESLGAGIADRASPLPGLNQEQILASLRIIDHSVRLPANSRVNVWVRTFNAQRVTTRQNEL